MKVGGNVFKIAVIIVHQQMLNLKIKVVWSTLFNGRRRNFSLG